MGQTTIAKNHKKVLDDLRVSMARLYEEYEIDGKLTLIEMSKYDRLQKLDKQVYDTITNLYKSNSKVIRGTLAGIVRETYISSIDIVEGTVKKKLKGIVRDIDVTKTVNTEMAGLRWTERLGKHRVDAIYDLQKEIKLGLTQGDTYGTMAKRLKDTLETDINKANTIVRTESHRCHATAKKDSLDSIAKHGVKMTKTYLSSKDEKVRSEHEQMDGVTIPYEEYFQFPDGIKTMSPGLSGYAKHDINCRCIITIDFLESVIKEHYEETIQNEPGITKDIKNIVEKNNGKIEGLDYRVKTFDSFERKASEEINKVKNVNEALGGIYDAIRYTSIKDADSLTEHYFSVVDDLQKEGYNVVRVKNSWGSTINPYRGINIIVESSTKQKLELQFHTPEGFDVKQNKQHKLYEEYRLEATSVKRKKELVDQMLELADSLKSPKNIDKIISFNKLGGD